MIDQFERYYTEKLWVTIPEVYRHEDGLDTPNKGVLRALVEILAAQAAVVRRSQDRLWDDQFIELCNEWAVPYIGELLGTRLLSAQNARGRRVDVAKTIYYRRRKGTPRILEELIADISGWDGKMTEGFQRLVRARHGLDPKPTAFAGHFSGTMPGGVADLRNTRAAELADGPFEEYHHTPDMRRQGRYGITKLNFFLYKLSAYRVEDATPFSLGDGRRFTFDPSGRSIQLFSQSKRPDDWDNWHSAQAWELAAPIPCRLLGHAAYQISDETMQQLVAIGSITPAQSTELVVLRGLYFKNEATLRSALSSLPSAAVFVASIGSFLRHSLVADCGKRALLPDGIAAPDDSSVSVMIGANTPTAEHIAAGNLHNWAALPASDKNTLIDPEHGRFAAIDAAIAPNVPVLGTYHYGFSGKIGAGTHNRPEVENTIPDIIFDKGGAIAAAEIHDGRVHQFDNNLRYGPIGNKLSVANLRFQAANQMRPYLRLESDWVLNTGANSEAHLVFDGLWLGGLGNAPCALVLRGDYERVTFKNCTLDPGGDVNALGETLHPVMLRIEGNVENLMIDACIMGPIEASGSAVVESLCICDSIVQSVGAGVAAIRVDTGMTSLQNVTVFGEMQVHRLEASDSIVTDAVQVLDTQTGCFRFSAAPRISRLPRPYEAFLFANDTNHWFSSRKFGRPTFAQISDTAPIALQRGAENGAEMGAFNSLMNPIKLDGLRTKVEEYMPFGLVAQFV